MMLRIPILASRVIPIDWCSNSQALSSNYTKTHIETASLSFTCFRWNKLTIHPKPAEIIPNRWKTAPGKSGYKTRQFWNLSGCYPVREVLACRKREPCSRRWVRKMTFPREVYCNWQSVTRKKGLNVTDTYAGMIGDGVRRGALSSIEARPMVRQGSTEKNVSHIGREKTCNDTYTLRSRT